MKPDIGLGAMLLCLVTTGAEAQRERYCYTPNGDRYVTSASRCPEPKREPTTIRRCTLPDGSKAFGDRCPVSGIKTEQLDETELSNRSSGAESKTNSERMIRYSAQRDQELMRERYEAEHQAEAERQRARAQEARRQYEAERQQQQAQPPPPPRRRR